MVVPDFRVLLEERLNMDGLYGCVIPGFNAFDMATGFKVSNFRVSINVGSCEWYQELKNSFITKQEFFDRLDNLILEVIEKDCDFIAFVKDQTPELCLKALRKNRKIYPCIKIVSSSSFEDCVFKLENKLKLEKLISQDDLNYG